MTFSRVRTDVGWTILIVRSVAVCVMPAQHRSPIAIACGIGLWTFAFPVAAVIELRSPQIAMARAVN